MTTVLTEGEYFGTNIKCLEDDFFSFTINKYSPGEEILKHCHENSYLSLLLGGNYSEINKSDNLELSKGALIFRPSLYNHSNKFGKDGGLCFNIEIKNKLRDIVDLDLTLPQKPKVYGIECNRGIYTLLYYMNTNFSNLLCKELVLDCIVDLSKEPPKYSLRWVEKVINILENETDTNHTIHSLAKRVFVHPIYLANGFKKKTGYTIGEFQMTNRLKKAFILLNTTNMPIKEIAFQTGFHDSAHFINSFKLVYKTAPGKFRTILKS